MDIVTIRLRDDGPLVIQGPVRIIDAEGREFTPPAEKPLVALCRCGQSANKPFCDGTHKRCNFMAKERAGGIPPEQPT
jgi:CDGSH-type Zn-finger protein